MNVLSRICAVLTSFPGGKIADRRHKKKNRVIGGGDLMHAMNTLQSAGQ
jgi:hypothetical protein